MKSQRLISSFGPGPCDEGVSDLVVDRIDVTTAIYREAPGSRNTGWSQAQVPARSKNENREAVTGPPPCAAATTTSRACYGARDTIARWPRDGDSRVVRRPRDTCEVAGRLCTLVATMEADAPPGIASMIARQAADEC
ncbi:serine carboxypeptidase-like 34 [Dorcoceras hygrometricum]|uniref:Serine carboxypeptidase-like 34 n=1 Tax=Dorcoceras hygrometricum TaxID=472368 RepID=A0A2Z7C115_9LAMI|nr:serine carboxypeptidase-like 34 [Dorcoceras hygrometricum]